MTVRCRSPLILLLATFSADGRLVRSSPQGPPGASPPAIQEPATRGHQPLALYAKKGSEKELLNLTMTKIMVVEGTAIGVTSLAFWYDVHLGKNVAIIAWVLAGAFVDFSYNLTLVDTLYHSFQVSSSIGYGDWDPPADEFQPDLIKKFRMVHIFLGIGVVTGFVFTKAKTVLDVIREKLSSLLPDTLSRTEATLDEAILETSLFFLLSTLFYATYESCTCSFGTSAVEGCTPDNCATTGGGYTKSIIDSLYMNAMSVSTVGFGDVAPKTRLGRCIAIPIYLIMIISFSDLARAFAEYDGVEYSERLMLPEKDEDFLLERKETQSETERKEVE